MAATAFLELPAALDAAASEDVTGLQAGTSDAGERLTDLASDGELLQQFLRGEQSAFAAVVERHARLVYCVCRRVLPTASDVDDAFQATFLVLAGKARGLRGWDSIAGWLHQTARRSALKLRTRIARRRAMEARAASHLASAGSASQAAAPDAQASMSELAGILDAEIARLPDSLREVVLLSQFEGLSRCEIAERLGIGVAAVKDRLERARGRLRGRLVRRGVTLSGAVLAAWLAPQTASAATIATLATTTTHAAAAFAAGSLAAGTLPAAASLAQGVLKMMGLEKLKVGAVCLVSLLTMGGLAYGMLHDDPQRFEKGIRGEVVELAAAGGGKTVTLSVEGFDTLLNLDIAADAKVWVAFEPGKIDDLEKGQYVSLRLADDHRSVNEIHVRGQQRDVKIRSVRDSQVLTIVDADNDDDSVEATEIPLAPDAIVRIGGLPATRDELKPGMRVPLELAHDGKTVNAVEFDGDPSWFVEGTLFQADAAAGTLKVNCPSENNQDIERTFDVPANTPIILDGKPAKLADLKQGAPIRLRTAEGQNTAKAIRAESPPPAEQPDPPATEEKPTEADQQQMERENKAAEPDQQPAEAEQKPADKAEPPADGGA